MKREELRSFFRAQMLNTILEQEEQPKEAGVDTPDTPLTLREPNTRARPARDSVDDQIDALILRYESASIRKEASLKESLSNLNLKFLIEQEEEEELPDAGDEDEATPPAEDPPADDAADEGPSEPAGSDDMQVTEPAPDQEIPDLDIDQFSMRVVRLMNNSQNLLRIEEAIINRAKSFLDENYGEVFVSEFMDNLRQKYGLDLDAYDKIPQVSDDAFAVGAFAGGTGGLGGGGGA